MHSLETDRLQAAVLTHRLKYGSETKASFTCAQKLFQEENAWKSSRSWTYTFSTSGEEFSVLWCQARARRHSAVGRSTLEKRVVGLRNNITLSIKKTQHQERVTEMDEIWQTGRWGRDKEIIKIPSQFSVVTLRLTKGDRNGGDWDAGIGRRTVETFKWA